MSNALVRGIICHENDQLIPAAYYFFRSCREENHPLGYYFLGMCLRHGFGIAKNEVEAFKCFHNAVAFLIEKLPIVKSKTGSLTKFPTPPFEFSLRVEQDSVLSEEGEKIPSDDLLQERLDFPELLRDYMTNEEQKVGVEIDIIKSILVLPIYELGNSLVNGWGVEKSKTLAEKMYLIGARIGDLDCQLALAHLYGNSFHSKKKKPSTVYWLREAARNGWSTYGQSWIWEKKYDDVEANRDKLLVGDDLQDLETISDIIKDFNGLEKLIKPPTHYCASACFKPN
jgi:TPR repeat protein